MSSKITLFTMMSLMIISCSDDQDDYYEDVKNIEELAIDKNSNRLIFTDGWETGCWRAYYHKKSSNGSCDVGTRWNNSQMQTYLGGAATTYVGEVANSFVPREGDYAMKFTWFRNAFDPDDPNNTSKAHLWTGHELKRNTKRWYGFSMYMPSGAGGMEPDEEPEILVQWHGIPDLEKGETYRIPAAAILHIKDRLVFNYYYDENEISSTGTIKLGGKIELGKADLDIWIDFLIGIEWDPDGNDGYLEINRKNQIVGSSWERIIKQTDGVKIGYNDISDPNFGIGIYKFNSSRLNSEGKPLSKYYRRQIFFDSFRMGSRYQSRDVIPIGSAVR